MRTGSISELEKAHGYVATTPVPKEHTSLKRGTEISIWQPLGRAAALMGEVHAALSQALLDLMLRVA